jgi:quercetin dioxygenase-like cupin family protein
MNDRGSTTDTDNTDNTNDTSRMDDAGTTALGTLVRHRDEGRATWMLNSLVITKADSAETAGAYGLMEHFVTAASNPPMHIQTDEEEAFYVLDGEIDFEVDGVTVHGTPGTFALVPRGAAHTYRVLTDTARMLVLASAPAGAPGGGLERFFDAVGEPAPAPVLPAPTAPDPSVLGPAAVRCGIEFVGPAPA